MRFTNETGTQVHHSTPRDQAVLERLIGAPPLEVDQIAAPWISVDGRLHQAASRWLHLKERQQLEPSSLRAMANRLASWIAFLREERGLGGPDEHDADVFQATHIDLVAYHRKRQLVHETAISPSAWRAERSCIKQFHEHLLRSNGVPLPFEMQRFVTARGYSGTSMVGFGPKVRQNSRGLPITPEYVSLLLQGAARIDRHGRQANGRTVERDPAIVSLAVATGMRLHPLAHYTHYELPRLTDAVITTASLPDLTTKGHAGSDALVFAHRLGAVWDYVHGARAEAIAEGQPYAPARPIFIQDADDHGWRHAGEADRKHAWSDTSASERIRMVDHDGTTPLLWLNTYKPHPLDYYSVAKVVPAARDWTREHVAPDFPGRFRCHDLRHTYATHLTVCIAKGAIAGLVHRDEASAYSVSSVSEAVELTKLSLGHASEASTNLYIQHAHKFLAIPNAEFLGGRPS